jgi:hypothetical protein
MPQFIRHHVTQYPNSSWVVSAVAGIVVGFLLALIVGYSKPALWGSNAANSAFAAMTAPDSKPVPEIKKPVRYEAIISNWKQYRAANQPRE